MMDLINQTGFAAILGAAFALVGRWLVDAVQRHFDERVSVYAKRMIKTQGDHDEPDHRLILLIENTASVSALVREIEFTSPADIKALVFVSVANKYFEESAMPINLAIPPFSIKETVIELQTPADIRSNMHSRSINGKISYVIRGKTKSKPFLLPQKDIIARWDQWD